MTWTDSIELTTDREIRSEQMSTGVLSETLEGTSGAAPLQYLKSTHRDERLLSYTAGTASGLAQVAQLDMENSRSKELADFVKRATAASAEFSDNDDLVVRDGAFHRFQNALDRIWLMRDRREQAFARVAAMLRASLKGLKSEQVRDEQWRAVMDAVQLLGQKHLSPQDARQSLKQAIQAGLDPLRPLGSWRQEED
jgi:FAD/FMN-containing dehydrogenase